MYWTLSKHKKGYFFLIYQPRHMLSKLRRSFSNGSFVHLKSFLKLSKYSHFYAQKCFYIHLKPTLTHFPISWKFVSRWATTTRVWPWEIDTMPIATVCLSTGTFIYIYKSHGLTLSLQVATFDTLLITFCKQFGPKSRPNVSPDLDPKHLTLW